MRIRSSFRLALATIGITLCCVGVFGQKSEGSSVANTTRYFKADGHTGAAYIALVPDGSYTVIGREHAGVSIEETGRWSESEAHITFSPEKPKKSGYSAVMVTYKKRTFLSLEGDSGPMMVIPIKEIEHDLDETPKALPPYVFFKVSADIHHRETKQPYPFVVYRGR